MEEGTKAAVSDTVLEQQGEKQEEGGLLDKIRSLLGGSQKKEEGPGVQTPAKDGKTAGETKEEGTDGKEASREKQAEKTYTQAELAAEIEKAVKEAKEAEEARRAEEKRLEKLSPQEREAEEREAMKKENAELTGKLKRMELEQKAAAKLAEKKLPVGLSEFLDYTDEARMAASLEKIGAMYQEQLETGIKERLKGTTPKGLGGAASLTDGMISAEIQKRIRGGL